MYNILRELFSVQSDDITYKNTVIRFLITLVLIVLLIIAANFLPFEIVSRIISGILVTISIYLFIAFFARLTSISDNKEHMKVKSGKLKFKFNPINVSLDDIILWLKETNEPETIYISMIDDEYHILEVWFDVRGRRGTYYNKQIYFDNKEYSENETIQLLQNKATNNFIKVYETYDRNKPEILIQKIDEIKNKLTK